MHRKTGKEWLHLSEIYEEVSKTKEVKNGESSIRMILENHSILSSDFKGEEEYVLKEKETDLYKSIYYEQIMLFENLEEGTIFSSDELMKTFKIAASGGIRKTNTYNCLVIVTDPKNGVYKDTKLENGKILYTGKGLYGDQELVGENKIPCEANIPIYFFKTIEKEKCMYLGKVVVDEFPYQVHELDKNNQDRLVWKFPLRLVSFKNKEEKEFQDIKFKISEMEEKVKVKLPDVSVTYKEGLPNIRKYNFIEHRKEKNEKTNYILNHMKQTILGDENEKRIFEIEYEKVKNAGALKEAEEMKQSFENKKNHEGYDILSFELNENGIYEKKYTR